MPCSDIDALNKFLQDEECLDELRPWLDDVNVFDILHLDQMEIRHSAMLAWLLNPSESHGLKDRFLRMCIREALRDRSDASEQSMAFLAVDTMSFSVSREEFRIDILAVSDVGKRVVAIENKVNSGEHDNQLLRYEETLERRYPGYKKLLVYLTPEGDLPSRTKTWCSLSYEAILDFLDGIQPSLESLRLPATSALLIDNYRRILRRKIVNDPNLQEICKKIYQRHKQAIDMIVENANVGANSWTVVIHDILGKIESEGNGEILLDEADRQRPNQTRFRTKRMDEYLPPLAEATGSWNTASRYYYWFRCAKKDEQSITIDLVFECGILNLDLEIRQKMEKLETRIKGRLGTWRDRFRRMYRMSKAVKLEALDDSMKLEETVNKMIANVQREEAKWLGKCLPANEPTLQETH